MEQNEHSYIDWEILDKEIYIPQIQDNNEIPGGPKEIHINRDENYNVNVILKHKEHFIKKNNNEAGSCFQDFFDIIGTEHGVMEYRLQSCYRSQSTHKHSQNMDGYNGEITIRTAGLYFSIKKEKKMIA